MSTGKLQVFAVIKKTDIDSIYLEKDKVYLKLTKEDWEEINNTLKGKKHILLTTGENIQSIDYQQNTIVYN